MDPTFPGGFRDPHSRLSPPISRIHRLKDSEDVRLAMSDPSRSHFVYTNYSPVHLNLRRSFSTISFSISNSRGKSHLELIHRPPRNSRRLLVRNGIECAPSSGVSDSRTIPRQDPLTMETG